MADRVERAPDEVRSRPALGNGGKGGHGPPPHQGGGTADGIRVQQGIQHDGDIADPQGHTDLIMPPVWVCVIVIQPVFQRSDHAGRVVTVTVQPILPKALENGLYTGVMLGCGPEGTGLFCVVNVLPTKGVGGVSGAQSFIELFGGVCSGGLVIPQHTGEADKNGFHRRILSLKRRTKMNQVNCALYSDA